MLAGLWMVYWSFGLVAHSLAPMLDRVRLDLGMSSSAFGLALGAWPLVYLAVAVPASKLMDRIGVRRGLVAGGLMVACSAFARAGAQGPVSLWLAVALFGVGGPLISIGAPKLVADWFTPEDRGRAVGIYSTASSAGAVGALLLAEPLLVPLLGSWRWVLIVYGLLVLLAVAIWTAVAKASPFGEVSREAGQRESTSSLLTDSGVRWVMGMAFGAFFVGHALGGWLPTVVKEAGWSGSVAGLAVAAGAAAGIVGALLFPPLATDRRRTTLLVLLSTALAGAIALVSHSSDLVRLVGVLGSGFVRVSIVPIAMLLLMNNPRISVGRMAAAGGLFFTAGEMGGVTGPIVVGRLRDASDGEFGSTIVLLVTVALVLAVCSPFASRANR